MMISRCTQIVICKKCAGNLATVYYEQGNLEMAMLNYRRAITCDAGFLEAYNNLVGLYYFIFYCVAVQHKINFFRC